MPFMIWHDEFLVDNSAIDRQHRRLVRLLNELYEARDVGRNLRTSWASALDELARYAQYHFATEASVLAAQGGTLTPAHRAAHHTFVARLSELRTSAERVGDAATQGSLELLRDWLVNHIRMAEVDCRAAETAPVLEVPSAASIQSGRTDVRAVRAAHSGMVPTLVAAPASEAEKAVTDKGDGAMPMSPLAPRGPATSVTANHQN